MSLYNILGTPTNSTNLEIHLAYKKRLRKVHPCVTRQGDTEFLELSKAYSILNDRYKRDFYDMMGENSIEILSHEKQAYAIVRIFDRFNTICYTMFMILSILNLLAYPILLYNESTSISIKFLCFSSLFLILPVIRNIRRLEFSLFDNLAAISLRFTFISVAFNLPKISDIILYIFGEVYNLFLLGSFRNIQAYIPLVINIMCLLSLKYCDTVLINLLVVYSSILIYLKRFDFDTIVYIGVSSLLSLYFSTLFLIGIKFTSSLIWLPHVLFACIVLVSIRYLFQCYIENLPHYSPKRLEIEYKV